MIRIEEEKKRICKELSMQVKKNALSLTSALETLTVIDVAFTKAKWAVRYDGCIPSLQSRDHSMYLEHAKHPLIDEKKVVCNTYELNDKQACLMISGPNMGGKTVTLKTMDSLWPWPMQPFPYYVIKPFYHSINRCILILEIISPLKITYRLSQVIFLVFLIFVRKVMRIVSSYWMKLEMVPIH